MATTPTNVTSSPPTYLAPGGDGSQYTGPNYNPDVQEYTSCLIRESLIYGRDRQQFSILGATASLAPNMGQKISQFIEIPLLDDMNQNDQGINAQGATIANGNLYGSSTNIGVLANALPTLTEGGGRVNRVGLTRIKRESSLQSYGFFTELDNWMLQFDNQGDLGRSIIRRLIDGTLEMIDHITQYKLLQNVGTAVFTGSAKSIGDISPYAKGTAAADQNGSLLNTQHLFRLEEILSANRTPYSEVLMDGSRNIDTRVVRTARIAFVGVELANYLRVLRDGLGNPAFIDVAAYSSQGNTIPNEIGSIGGFRIIQVRRMLKYAGMGAEVSSSDTGNFRTSTGSDGNQHYDVFPFLVLGDEAFACTGLEMGNGQFRLNVITKFPGRETAHAFNDPYGERGFSSIKFWHGILPLKTERIACIYTALPTC